MLCRLYFHQLQHELPEVALHKRLIVFAATVLVLRILEVIVVPFYCCVSCSISLLLLNYQ